VPPKALALGEQHSEETRLVIVIIVSIMGVMFHLARDEDIAMLWMSPMASIKPWAAIEKVLTFTAIETVVAIFAKKFVLPSAPVEAIPAVPAAEGIIATPSFDGIVSTKARNDIRPSRALEDIVAGRTENRHWKAIANTQ